MSLEEMHTVLTAASGGRGAKYDVVRKWFLECGIIDAQLIDEESYERSYIRINPNKEELSLVEFIQLIGILSRHTRKDPSDFIRKFEAVKNIVIDEIRAAFDTSICFYLSGEALKAKLIDEAAAEEKARKLFEGVKDTKNVELEKFKEVVAKLAAEQKKNVEDFTKRLGEQGTRLLNAAMAGASAFKDALAKK